MTIGERIKRLRLYKCLTQEDLAVAAATTKQTIYKYENNIVTNIPSDKIEAIADCLGVSAPYLMGWEDSAAYQRITDAINAMGRVEKDLDSVSTPQKTLASESLPQKWVTSDSDLPEKPLVIKEPNNLSREVREVMKALDLYQQYLNAQPHERAAVDALLKWHRSDP